MNNYTLRMAAFAASLAAATIIPSCKTEEKNCDTAREESLNAREIRLKERETALEQREAALLNLSSQGQVQAQGLTPTFSNPQAQNSTADLSYSADQKSKGQQSAEATHVAYKRPANGTPGQYPESSDRLISQKDIEHQTSWGMKVMENEIYARHGYVFANPDLKKHFRKENWYRGSVRSMRNIHLTPTEVQNVAFIHANEQYAKR